MSSPNRDPDLLRAIVEGTRRPALDVLGPTVEFLTAPGDGEDDLCVMRGVIPPGVIVAVERDDDAEAFLVLRGRKQVLLPGAGGLEWTDVRAGDYIHVPRNAPHAHRNPFGEPVVDLVVATARLGRWFQEVGRPATGRPQPPAPDDVARLLAVSARYRYWVGSPDENAAVGIELPALPPGSGR